ncbi:hypothetical protein [Halomonas litopenaei]|uniref:hypothetical protein n=1 Tax=Halomonas litopenaei TaxID=2109328 RepID=UPI003FA14307
MPGSLAVPNICLRDFSWPFPASRSFLVSFSDSVFACFFDAFAIRISRCSKKTSGYPRSALFAKKNAEKHNIENALTFATGAISKSDFSLYSSHLHAHNHEIPQRFSTIPAE